jgi:CheY-like chemotaxis protein
MSGFISEQRQLARGRSNGKRIPGAEAPCFSVAGIARTKVRAYLRSNGDGKSESNGDGKKRKQRRRPKGVLAVGGLGAMGHNRGMVRPCFLVIDREFASSISTRKLVVETAKLNVITAYSGREAIETMRKFPALDGVVMDVEMRDMDCEDAVRALRELNPKLPIIAVSSPQGEQCEGADYHLESFDPRALLELLRKLCPDEAAVIEKRNEDLENEAR